jgi:hypothetical protein
MRIDLFWLMLLGAGVLVLSLSFRRTRALGVALLAVCLALLIAVLAEVPAPREAGLNRAKGEEFAALGNEGLVGDSPVWSTGMAREFDADLYASAKQALDGLARWVGRGAGAAADGQEATAELLLVCTPRGAGLCRDFEAALREQLPGTRIVADPSSTEAGTEENVVTLSVLRGTQPGSGARPGGRRSEIEVSLVMGETVARRRVAYVDKLWVENFAAFVAEQGDLAVIRARSAAAGHRPGASRAGAVRCDAGRRREKAGHSGPFRTELRNGVRVGVARSTPDRCQSGQARHART